MEILGKIRGDLAELDSELVHLKVIHDEYSKKVHEMKQVQKKCQEALTHNVYRLTQISDDFNSLKINSYVEKLEFSEVKKQIEDHKCQYDEISTTLPKKNGWYLRLVLGSVNVILHSKEDKFAYKKDYEQFKFYVTCVSLTLSFLFYFLMHNRILDALYHFLLVWYFCTLTIREYILIANGSRIKWWWMTHHFITIILTAIVLIWPKSQSYSEFRDLFMLLCFYLSIVQCIQHSYQLGCLYKLRALGQAHSMDITVDGFVSWMWKRLSFVIPFLLIAYAFQFYCAYRLYDISQKTYCKEWMALWLSVMFFILSFGNTVTTLAVFRQKLRKEGYSMTALGNRLMNKYGDNNADIASGDEEKDE